MCLFLGGGVVQIRCLAIGLLCLFGIAGAGCLRSGFQEPKRSSVPVLADAGRGDVEQHADAGVLGDVLAPDHDSLWSLAQLQTQWTTSYSAAFSWIFAGDEQRFDHFELWIALSLAELESETGSTQKLGPEELPELGWYQLPNTSGFDPVSHTVVHGLLPDTQYFVQLSALSNDGQVARSEPVTARTLALPNHEIVIFSERDTDGYSIPAGMYLSDQSPYGGQYHYRWDNDCEDGEDRCFENLRRQDFALSMASLGEADFAHAYFEVAIANPGDQPSPWSQLGLTFFREADQSEQVFVVSPLTFAVMPGYQLWQVPLRAFSHAGLPLDFEDMSGDLVEFRVGGSWCDDTAIDLDEIRIRW